MNNITATEYAEGAYVCFCVLSVQSSRRAETGSHSYILAVGLSGLRGICRHDQVSQRQRSPSDLLR